MAYGISVVCFAASYAVALAIELVSLKVHYGWHRVVMLAFALAGIVAHTWYLGTRAVAVPDAPLASVYDWCLLAAWALAILYLVLVFTQRRTAVGLFVLPLTLLLVGAAQLASQTPLGAADSSRFWGVLHAGALLLGTVTVCVGFLAGLMYLIQSYRLKHALPARDGFRLPSLEWLERINSRSLGVSAATMAFGFVSGVILSRMKHHQEAEYTLWADPVVLSLAAMMSWLICAEVFRMLYPAARRGRKVAYLTLAAFVFLLFTLVSTTMLDSTHSAQAAGSEAGSSELGEQVP